MTLFDLVLRSMRKNIKHYYLYFFALIFSTSLYFVFSTLQHDSSIVRRADSDLNFDAAFKVAGILLISIVVVFTVYANRIFLRRRSKEIGLYQLVGLTKKAVARLLITENVLLGAGALLIGICGGALVSRLFLLILLKLLGFEGFIAVTFSIAAAIQTAIVFASLIVLTSAQMAYTVYRNTLLGLFHADKQGEHPKKPKTFASAVLAVLGMLLIAFGYLLSGYMVNALLFFNMLAVLGSTIFGTYLLFRVTIGWLFYRFRKSRDGHLGLANSMSLAPLMHRMKANANSLTLIAVLSAMTLTMIAVSYSLYYSAESDTRISLPYDFAFENNEKDAKSFRSDMEKEGIRFVHKPIDAIRLIGTISDKNKITVSNSRELLFLPAEQLQEAGADLVAMPGKGEVVQYNPRLDFGDENMNYPMVIVPNKSQSPDALALTQIVEKFVMNRSIGGLHLVAQEETIKELMQKMPVSRGNEAVRIDTFQVPDKNERAAASDIYAKYVPKHAYMPDFHKQYKESLQTFGMLIFIAGFLGLAFLISTGSILYFKQMTEAEQEKMSYTTLRQLGFEVKDVMRGIVRKQLFVYGIPLAIGLLHSVFAVKAASILVLSDITFPSATAMGVYVLIYIVFAFLTVGYYRRIVKAAL